VTTGQPFWAFFEHADRWMDAVLSGTLLT